MEKKIKDVNVDDVLDLIEKPLVNYIMQIMKAAGMPVNKDGAENVLANVGTRIQVRKIR